jgi:Asp-tRNA(Asn)/Glu-tRNA(Gln) amidotransferase A subunit family amidase
MKIMSDSLDTIGVIARSVADCALFAAAVSGRDLGDPDRKPDHAPRIGICRSPSWGHAGAETVGLFDRVSSALQRAGAMITDRELPLAMEALATAHPIIMNRESARALGWELTTRPDQISGILRERLESGLSRTEAEAETACGAFVAARQAVPTVFEGLDVLVTPAAPGQAPEGLGWTGDPVFNYIWTSLHVPCVTVPAGEGPDGLPLGIQVVARNGADAAVLAWAQWVARAVS